MCVENDMLKIYKCLLVMYFNTNKDFVYVYEIFKIHVI